MLSARDAYKEELLSLAWADERIVCLEADLGGHDNIFAKNLPHRFINVGIAEMAGLDLAASLEEAGFIPFFSTFAAFAALRAAEGIKLNLGYMNRNLKLVCPYGGVSGAWFGTTHHCLEDYGIIGHFPNIKILCPHGEKETRRVVREAAAAIGPYYIRLSRNEAFESLPAGEGLSGNRIVWQGDREAAHGLCLVSVGEKATEFCRQLHEVDSSLQHAHLVYIDTESLRDSVAELKATAGSLVVVEEHRAVGSVAASLALLDPELKVYSFNCGQAWPCHGGTHEEVLAELGFTRERLAELVAKAKHVDRTT